MNKSELLRINGGGNTPGTGSATWTCSDGSTGSVDTDDWGYARYSAAVDCGGHPFVQSVWCFGCVVR